MSTCRLPPLHVLYTFCLSLTVSACAAGSQELDANTKGSVRVTPYEQSSGACLLNCGDLVNNEKLIQADYLFPSATLGELKIEAVEDQGTRLRVSCTQNMNRNRFYRMEITSLADIEKANKPGRVKNWQDYDITAESFEGNLELTPEDVDTFDRKTARGNLEFATVQLSFHARACSAGSQYMLDIPQMQYTWLDGQGENQRNAAIMRITLEENTRNSMNGFAKAKGKQAKSIAAYRVNHGSAQGTWEDEFNRSDFLSPYCRYAGATLYDKEARKSFANHFCDATSRDREHKCRETCNMIAEEQARMLDI